MPEFEFLVGIPSVRRCHPERSRSSGGGRDLVVVLKHHYQGSRADCYAILRLHARFPFDSPRYARVYSGQALAPLVKARASE